VVGRTAVGQEADSDLQQNAPQGGGHGVGHVPVLLQIAIDFLNVRRGGTFIDATVGLAGHSFEIAKLLGAPGHKGPTAPDV